MSPPSFYEENPGALAQVLADPVPRVREWLLEGTLYCADVANAPTPNDCDTPRDAVLHKELDLISRRVSDLFAAKGWSL